MEDFNSKYTGRQVEDLLDQVASGNVGGGVTEESDPIFSASPSAGITEENISSWNNKVDKVNGKQLSTEDFTTALKQRLEGLSNYDDTEISEAVNQLREDLDALVSGDSTTAIKTFNEIIAFLSGIEDSENLDSIIASIEQQIAGKQNSITDLDAIRSGASKGATSVQPDDIAQVATSGSYVDLTNKPTIPSGNGAYITPFTWEDLYYGMLNGEQIQSDTFALMEAMQARKTILVPISNDYHGTFVLNGYYEDLLYFSITDTAGNVITCGGTPFDVDYIDGQELQYHEWGKKQDTLVSGTNIKTVNGQSILGSGDITISGGSSSGGGGYAEVSHGTSDTTFSLTPNTFHVWDEVASLDLELGAETSGVANEYLFQFTSGATPTTLTLPDDIKWANDTAPTIAENMIYQVSILKSLASVLEFSNEASVFPAILVYNGDNGDVGVKVYEELYAIAGSGSGTLNENDLVFNFSGRNVNVTNFFYISTPYAGYVIHDTGMEYYILTSTGNITYYFYD